MSTRIGDFAQSTRLTTLLQGSQTRIREAQLDISSGKNAQRFDEIASDARLLLRSREQRELTERYIGENSKVMDRLQLADGAMGRIVDVAERFREVLIARRQDASGALVPLTTEVESLIQEVQGQLNIRLDDRYLFAGSKTDTPPVAIPEPLPAGLTAADYYQGDDRLLTVRADVDIEFTYGVTAADPAFERLFNALVSARDAELTDDRNGLGVALDEAGEALSMLVKVRNNMNANYGRLESIRDGQDGGLVYLNDIIGRIQDTDLTEATTRLATDSAMLEASYLAVARINNLTLADYIR